MTNEKSRGIGSIPAKDRVYQFKITLKNVEPPIWRRIQIRGGTLQRLHEYIQLAFGWRNCHLHKFTVNNVLHGDPELLWEDLDDLDIVESTMTRIRDILPESGERFGFEYEYDFGDGWKHEVLFEGCLVASLDQSYPFCVEGAGACPPEDVGGVEGYARYRDALANPNHAEHERYSAWWGDFDPESFDVDDATERMRQGMPQPGIKEDWMA